MTMIGIDPHKATHTAVAVDDNEVVLDEFRLRASTLQAQRLCQWADGFEKREWAVESANGLGYLVAQQPVAAGETVFDVPPLLASRVRVLGSGRSHKNDPNDARSVVIAALRSDRLARVRPDDHSQVLRMLAKRHRDMARLRNKHCTRLHALLLELEVLEDKRHATDGALWRLIRTRSDEIGWVNSSFLANSAVIAGERTAEEQLADAFVEFATRPSDDTFAALPLADTVSLGLGSEIAAIPAGPALRDADTWELEMEYFRATVGPFSALRWLADAGDYKVTVGPHNHCASPPVPAPAGFEDLTRVSIQPADGSIDGCLMWGTVDFFINADGEAAAITRDFWEP